MDFILSLAVSAWANPDKPGNLQRFLSPQSTSTKIELLSTLLPKDWRDGGRLVDCLLASNSHRNALAHSNLAMGGADGTRSYGWHFWNVKGRFDRRLEIDSTKMSGELTKATVVREAVSAIMQEGFLRASGDINDVSLSDAILETPGTWATHEAHAQFQAAVREMFPRH